MTTQGDIERMIRRDSEEWYATMRGVRQICAEHGIDWAIDEELEARIQDEEAAWDWHEFDMECRDYGR